jgi:dihydrofolate synthase/folylpolyglutamate synthase
MKALSEEDIVQGLAATRWPGRLEPIQTDPLVVIDVGHTPAAVRVARAGFENMAGERRRVLVCGVSEDKPVEAIVEALAPGFSTVICTPAHHKGRAGAELGVLAAAAHPGAEIVVAENVADARLLALAKAGAGGAVYVAGSLFLAAEFKAAHLGRDPALLVFF